MRRIALTLTLEDEESRTSFTRECRDEKDPEKEEVGRLLVEVLLAMERSISGAYPLTCLAEALAYLDFAATVEPDMTVLIEAAEEFLKGRKGDN